MDNLGLRDLALGPDPLFSLELIFELSSMVSLFSYLEKWDLLILCGEIFFITGCILSDLAGESLLGFFLGGSSAKITFLIEGLLKIDFFFGPRKSRNC